MRRVYVLWFLRKLTSPAVLKVVVLVALIWRSSRYVSYKDVVLNSPSIAEVGASVNFFTSAFINTELYMQLLLIGVVLVATWSVYDLAHKMFSSHHHHAI